VLDVVPNSKGNKFRARRIGYLKTFIDKVVAEKGTCKILDVGGTADFWNTWADEIDWKTCSITCVNLPPVHEKKVAGPANITIVAGDACNLTGIKDNEYDIVFSNSVIEHVGTWQAMMDMANEVRRVAPRYIVQTPYYWFPIEAHARVPFIHWLPQPIGYRMVMMRKNGFWEKGRDVSHAVSILQSALLVDVAQMKALFPDAEIMKERFFGFTKSLVAIRG
jgi:hypothetical protein